MKKSPLVCLATFWLVLCLAFADEVEQDDTSDEDQSYETKAHWGTRPVRVLSKQQNAPQRSNGGQNVWYPGYQRQQWPAQQQPQNSGSRETQDQVMSTNLLDYLTTSAPY